MESGTGFERSSYTEELGKRINNGLGLGLGTVQRFGMVRSSGIPVIWRIWRISMSLGFQLMAMLSYNIHAMAIIVMLLLVFLQDNNSYCNALV